MRNLSISETQDVNGGFGWIVVAIVAGMLAGCGKGEEKPKPVESCPGEPGETPTDRKIRCAGG